MLLINKFLFFPPHRSNADCLHSAKSVRIRSFSDPCFPAFGLNMERYSVHFLVNKCNVETVSNIWPILHFSRPIRLQMFISDKCSIFTSFSKCLWNSQTLSWILVVDCLKARQETYGRTVSSGTVNSECWQKQPFADVLQNRCSIKFHNIHRKTPVLKSPFNKVTGLKACNFVEKKLQYRFFSVKFAKFLRTIFFDRTPLVAATVLGLEKI